MKSDTTPTWNLKTVLQVQKEFRRHTEASFLCLGSETFGRLYENSAAWIEVRAAAATFLFNQASNLDVGQSFLFVGGGDWDRRAFRLAFLRHEVKRLKQLETTTP